MALIVNGTTKQPYDGIWWGNNTQVTSLYACDRVNNTCERVWSYLPENMTIEFWNSAQPYFATHGGYDTETGSFISVDSWGSGGQMCVAPFCVACIGPETKVNNYADFEALVYLDTPTYSVPGEFMTCTIWGCDDFSSASKFCVKNLSFCYFTATGDITNTSRARCNISCTLAGCSSYRGKLGGNVERGSNYICTDWNYPDDYCVAFYSCYNNLSWCADFDFAPLIPKDVCHPECGYDIGTWRHCTDRCFRIIDMYFDDSCDLPFLSNYYTYMFGYANYCKELPHKAITNVGMALFAYNCLGLYYCYALEVAPYIGNDNSRIGRYTGKLYASQINRDNWCCELGFAGKPNLGTDHLGLQLSCTGCF